MRQCPAKFVEWRWEFLQIKVKIPLRGKESRITNHSFLEKNYSSIALLTVNILVWTFLSLSKPKYNSSCFPVDTLK